MTNSETKNFSQNVSSSYHLEDRGKCNKNELKTSTHNIPKLRFKGYNDEWKKIKLGEHLNICRGASPRPIEKYITVENNGVNWIKIGDISPNENVIKCTKEKITIEGAKHSRYVRKGDLILSNSMSFGRPYILEIDGCIHDGWLLIQDLEKLFDKKYLCYLLDSDTVKQQYRKYAAGGVVINLNSELVRSVKVYIPNFHEQEKIASFLTLIDKKIEKQKELVELLKKYKRGLLSVIFSQKLRFKDDNGNNYPAWEEKYIQDVCSITTGKGNTQDKEENGVYPFYVRSPIVEKSNKYIFDGEAVLTVGDGVGTGKVFHYVNGKFNFHQRVYKMSNFSGINGRYFYYYFSTHFYDRVKRMTAKTSVDSVRMDMIAKMPIFIPTNEEQDKIINLLTNVEDIFLKNEESLFLLQEYKKGLLQKMFI